MPQFMLDWNQWWVDYWTNHPTVFWIAVGAVLALTVLQHRLRK